MEGNRHRRQHHAFWLLHFVPVGAARGREEMIQSDVECPNKYLPQKRCLAVDLILIVTIKLILRNKVLKREDRSSYRNRLVTSSACVDSAKSSTIILRDESLVLNSLPTQHLAYNAALDQHQS